MKINKKYLLLRLITFPFKLAFTLIWYILFSIKQSIQWLLFGSNELCYGIDYDKASLVKLIEQNEEMLNKLNRRRY